MREKFIGEFIANVSDMFDKETLYYLKEQLTIHIDKYELTERCTEIDVVNNIPECVKVYLVTRKIEGISEKSLSLYALRIKQFFQYTSKKIDDIDATDVRLFLYNLQHERGISDRTLDGVRSIICTFFKWCCAEGYIKHDPTVTIKKIKYEKKQRGHLSEIEIEMLRDACRNDRDRAIIETLYSTGCRVSELVGMSKDDIDFTSGEVNVLGKGNKHRTVYLNTKASISIRRYFAQRNDDDCALFVSSKTPHKRLSKNMIENIVARIGNDAGISRKCYPHLIRHTTATHALERGMEVTNVQKILGHTDLNTTMIYAEVTDSSVKMSHKKCIV